MLTRSWSEYLNEPAMAFTGEDPITYGGLRDRVIRIAVWLKAIGIGQGDAVAILSENHINWGAAFFAITSIGAVAVPVMHEFPLDDVRRILDDSLSVVVLAAGRFVPDLLPVLPARVRTLMRIEDFAVVHDADGTGAVVPEHADVEWDDVVNTDVRETDTAALIFTSGTSSLSKGVVLQHRNLVSNAVATGVMIGGMTPEDSMLSILPLAHTTECTLGLIIPIMHGASIHYLRKPPAAATLLPALELVRPTVMLAVPLVVEKIHRNRILPQFRSNAVIRTLYRIPAVRRTLHRVAGRKLFAAFGGRLRMLCIGGAALAPDVEHFLREARFPYTVGYGLTETAPLVTGTVPAEFAHGSCGRPLPGVAVRIGDPDPLTGEGEVQVKGPNVMAGYQVREGAEPPVQPFTPDGWLRTGDLGVLNADGFLFIRGRIKTMVVHSNGKNTYPEAVEQLIHEHRFVEEAFVYMKDAILRAAVFLNREELEAFWRDHKVPEINWEVETRRILDAIRAAVNRKLPPWSHLKLIELHPVPFEKTPSKKVKRWMYV